MKTERIIWGLLFLFIGGVLLLDNFNVIDFHWEIIWRFWPLVLIIIGANLIFSKEDSAKAGVISIILTIAALSFIGYQGTKGHLENTEWKNEDSYEGYENEREGGESQSSSYSADLSPDTKIAELNIEGGATKYTLSDTTSKLFEAEVRRRKGAYSLLRTTKDSVTVLNFKMQGKEGGEMKEFGDNKAEIKLNSNPVWDVNLNLGAGKIDFDLSAYKVRNLTFEGGAASVYVRLGQPLNLTTVNVETGVSKIKISIPSSAACQINVDSGLSTNDFEGFNKLDDGTYRTENFEKANKKIIVNLQGGLSKFKVERY